MGILDGILDSSDPSVEGAGPNYFLPQVTTAFGNDPRMAIAAQLLKEGQQGGYTTPLLGLSRALTQGLGAYTQGSLLRGYGQLNQSTLNTIAAALKAGTGTPATIDANGNSVPAQPGNLDQMLDIEATNPILAPSALQTKLAMALKNAEPYTLPPNNARVVNGVTVASNAQPLSDVGRTLHDLGINPGSPGGNSIGGAYLGKELGMPGYLINPNGTGAVPPSAPSAAPTPASPQTSAQPPQQLAYADAVNGYESTNIPGVINPNARNPNSSAVGPAQALTKPGPHGEPSTWDAIYNKYLKDRGYPNDPTNPDAARAFTTAYAADNAQTLATATGRVPTNGDLYLAHFLGGQGAARMLTAPPNAPAAQY